MLSENFLYLVIMNIKLENDQGGFNYSNINIEVAYINSSTLENLRKNNIIDKLDYQPVKYFNNRQIAIKDIFISEEQRKEYKYLVFSIKEREESIETNEMLKITFEGVDKNNIYPEYPIPPNLFFFDYIEPSKSNSTFYLIDNSDIIYIEFSSCSNDFYSFYLYNNTQIIKQISDLNFINGKITFSIFPENITILYLKIE